MPTKVEGDLNTKTKTILRQFKLHLDEGYSKDPLPVQVDLIRAIADYLKAMNSHVKGKIMNDNHDSYNQQDFRYCLTVPAMWSERAKNSMRQAALLAELINDFDHPDRLLLVTEPEAAALYCQLKCTQFDLGHKDRFMVCDAGGGTVDLIVYEVEKTNEGTFLSEVTKGHGASCGSIFLDQNFKRLVQEKFSSQGVTLEPKPLNKIVENFVEHVKPIFESDSDHALDLPVGAYLSQVRDPEAIEILDGSMLFSRKELESRVFDPVIEQVYSLIDQQLSSARDCTAIILVGGFGASNHLLARVRRQFEGLGIKIVRAPRPELAVVRGAVYAALKPKIVTTRVSRQCYGIRINMRFREGIDGPLDRKEFSHGSYCHNRFKCLVQKGQKVQTDECISTTIMCRKGTSNDVLLPIYAFSGDGETPDFIHSKGMYRLADIRVKSAFSPSDPLDTKLEYQFKMFIGRNEIKSVVLLKGEEYAASIDFDSEQADNKNK
ncbi:Heat shock 70 kDa protein 12A [Lunasporangiospora selenospora]|uniref:Heat shock 70 kDa protein 12A n=1 Tax=Lunasporangiospora selenospora TaxID=979761 RepID=A0A9P6G3M7_9FUNG|nr:Heat shock 70 kDa protein 12A [Lunasporangiospora selenospora]